MGTLLKRSGFNIAITQISNTSQGFTAFTVGVIAPNIRVTTDNGSSVTCEFIGAN